MAEKIVIFSLVLILVLFVGAFIDEWIHGRDRKRKLPDPMQQPFGDIPKARGWE